MMESALKEYYAEVKSLEFPSNDHFYEINEDELEKLLADSSWKYEKDRVENLAEPKHSVTPRTSSKIVFSLMKSSDYIVDFLIKKGIDTHLFLLEVL